MSEATTTKRKLSPQELLDIRERQWRPRANAISLAAEAFDDIPAHRREQTLTAYGRLEVKLGPGQARERLFRRYPAVHVLATAGVAADHYERGTFWPKLAALLGIRQDPEFQRDWGEAFLDNLRRLGLPTFEQEGDAGTRYVGRILLHSGMPTYCLGDFFRTLAWKRSVSPGFTPEEFVSWAATKAASGGFANVDMPVQRFLRYGDEFALDVVDRSFELLDTVASGAPAEDALLPQRFWAAAQHLHNQQSIGLSHDAALVRTRADFRPRLVLDPYGQGLILRLPPVGDAPDGRAVWIVALDDETQRVATESLWPGSTEPAPQTDLAVTKPVRAASVALGGREDLQLPIAVVDDKDPLLAFGENCELIPHGLPLPSAKVWLLFPGDLDSLRTVGNCEITAENPLPPRWSGFSLVQVDLREANAVSVGGSTRTIRKLDAARVDIAAPVRGIRTTSGLPVIADLPHIDIPSSMAKADWDITLHNSSGDLVARHRLSGAEDADALWSHVPRPLAGTFTVRVRGPWGRGATSTFNIVEGLTLTSTPSWRRFAGHGLQQCSATIRAADGVELSNNRIEFGERDREHRVRVGVRGEYRSLVISPPHMTVAYQTPGAAIAPSVSPLPLISEDIREAPGELVLDIGAAAEPNLHVLAGGAVVQTVLARTGKFGIYRFNLADITDTLGQHPHAVMALSSDGELRVATVRPRTLFTDISLDTGHLVFADCANAEGLNAYLFAARAPWRQPECVPIVNSRAALPGWLIDAGPIRVMARVEDPWVPLPAPDWPQVGKSMLVEADGWVTDGDPEECAISAFLAGDTSQSVEVIDFVRLWTARALLPSLGLGSRISEISEAIDTEIYGNPVEALTALSDSEAPSDAIPTLMVRSGLAWANLADSQPDSAPVWTLRGALPAALLAAADSCWSDEEIDGAISVCGDAVNGLLDGEDPYASAGSLDESADLLDQNPALREQFIREAQLVPQGLLSQDSRVLAAMDLVANRRDDRLDWLLRNARGVLREGERLIRMINDPATQKAVDARRHPTKTEGWYAIPAVSMVLALVARHAARGNADAVRWLRREQRPWANLAAVLPQLVTIDLIIAELIVGRRAEEVEVSE